MSLSNVLKTRRKELGLTLAEIADRMNVSEATVQRWESGNIKNMRHERVAKLAEILRVSPAFLMGWEDSDTTENTSPLPSNLKPIKTKKLPLIGSIACGTPILADQNIERYVDVMDSIRADYCLECKGDSMTGARIYDGDLVCIRLQPMVENGQIAAVRVGDEATLKRVYLSPNQIVLQAENPAYTPMVYTGSDLEDIEIIGKAVAFVSMIK